MRAGTENPPVSGNTVAPPRCLVSTVTGMGIPSLQNPAGSCGPRVPVKHVRWCTGRHRMTLDRRALGSVTPLRGSFSTSARRVPLKALKGLPHPVNHQRKRGECPFVRNAVTPLRRSFSTSARFRGMIGPHQAPKNKSATPGNERSGFEQGALKALQELINSIKSTKRGNIMSNPETEFRLSEASDASYDWEV